MANLRLVSSIAGIIGLTVIVGCSTNTPPASTSSPTTAPKPASTEGEHGHNPSAHGGTLVSIGKDNYHAEAVFEQGGKLRLYMLGADETKVIEIESQTLSAFVKASGAAESLPFELKANPQPGDAAGKTSQFLGEFPIAVVGKRVEVTIPSLRIGSERFRVAFSSGEAHADAAMPAKLGTDEERKLFLTSGGIYSDADIKANGTTIPSVKFKGIRAEHNNDPKPGVKICPITDTVANPKFSWVIGGKSYEFCCTPCIEEFVALSKEKPGEIKDPKEYVKK